MLLIQTLSGSVQVDDLPDGRKIRSEINGVAIELVLPQEVATAVGRALLPHPEEDED